MARRNEAAELLLKGLTPQEIGKRMGISLGSVRQYLCTLVGEGELYRADIAFNIGEKRLIEDVIRSGDLPAVSGPNKTVPVAQHIREVLFKNGHNIPRDLIELYLVTRDPRSDLYALICEFEVRLHRTVKQALKSVFEDSWWQKGIPEQTRKNCQIRKEEDTTPINDPYQYTTFIDLKSIIEKNWNVFVSTLPKTLTKNKQDTLQNLVRVNEIRNRVMHPVKPIIEYETDYRFVRSFLSDFDELASS